MKYFLILSLILNGYLLLFERETGWIPSFARGYHYGVDAAVEIALECYEEYETADYSFENCVQQ